MRAAPQSGLTWPPRRWRALAVVLFACLLFSHPGLSRAAAGQVTILEDDPRVIANPTATLSEARALGVTVLRLKLPWGAVAPRPTFPFPPRFDATNPAAYGPGAWAPYDAVIIAAHRLGIRVDLNLDTGAPRWATGSGQPRKVKGYPFWQWEPDPTGFGRFAQAAGERYSGNFDPVTGRLDPGNPADLPRVNFWSIWNEPNYGPSLAPQRLPGHPGVEDSPRMYRNLVDAAWAALARTGHRTPADTILIGELAPRSQLTPPGAFGDFNGMTPMVFLEALYCVDIHFRPLRGQAANLRGCPSTAGGSARFRVDNPGLFQNSGISDHPYDERWAPNQELNVPVLKGWALENSQDTSLATIGVLERGLNQLTAAYGDHVQLPIWDTEYGYQTALPHRVWKGDPRPWPSQATAAAWDNWAEYLHWKDPRIRSFAQYILQDPLPALVSNDYGGFASGLVSFNGTPKPGLAAFRMPLFLPRTVASSPGAALEVWGDVRPAAVPGLLGLGAAQNVTLEFRPLRSRRFLPLGTLALGAGGYYDGAVRFPSSGTLEARWAVPAESLIAPFDGNSTVSSQVSVTVR